MKRWILTISLLTACGGAQSAPEASPTNIVEVDTPPANSHGKPSIQTEEKDVLAPSITSVTKAELDAIIKKGPGHVLAMVQTDSVMENGKFAGFKIVSFRLDAATVLGLQTGDVIRSINGIPVARPEHLVKIFERLKTATSITFSITRGNVPIDLSTPVQ